MRVFVIGAGEWGTTMALHLAHKGFEVHLWARDAEYAARLETERENERYVPGHGFPPALHAVHAAPGACDVLVGAVPTQYSRRVLEGLAGSLPPVPFVSLAKGIEIETGKLPTEIYREVAGADRPSAVLTGPCIASEIVRGLPTAVVIAGDEAEMLQDAFSTERFRVYTSADRVGAELCAALKNVLAIAAGIVDGMELGANTKATLLTRGIVELTRLGVALGAQARTFTGLAGFGDLFTTCVSRRSRNRSLGERIGRGDRLDDVVKEMTQVAEGVPTTRAVIGLAREYGVEMPITTALHAILFEGASLEEAVGALMTRRRRAES